MTHPTRAVTSTGRRWWLVAAVAAALVAAGVALAVVFGGLGDSEPPPAAETADATSPGEGRERMIDGLDNVAQARFALGQVWAVTSDLANNYSQGEANARIVRIDTGSGSQTLVMADLEVQPLLLESHGLLWAKLVDRIVGFDGSGAEAVTVPWAADGELIGGDEVLWVTDFPGGRVAAIDPTRGEVREVIDTVRFPVAPITAFGHVWLPSSTDGTVGIIDEATLGRSTNRIVAVTDGRQKDVTAVPAGPTGDEVWVRDFDGGYTAISAATGRFGELRRVTFDRSINRVIPIDDRLLLLPSWGLSVLVADLATGQTLAELRLDAIPFRAVVVDGPAGREAWVSSDGGFEGLFHIDLESLEIVERFAVGENSSTTTGPTQPFLVGDEVWIPNRGDNKVFVVDRAFGR
ncbi:MAG: hypothetical protein AAGA65_07715 [Actinomycetota bacterium]